jgi:hypothetical protein
MLVEALAALVTALTVLLALTTVLIAYLQRVKTDQSAAEIEDVGSRMAASITQATKTASQWAIYLDRASYLADPVSNVASQGNVLVCDTSTQSGEDIIVLFEYDPGAATLTRFENSFAQISNTLSKASLVAGSSAVFDQNLGLVRGHWTLSDANELVDFEAYGTPLRMR